jgi:hypothetical protein
VTESPPGGRGPAALRALWRGWKAVARRVGDVQARILLTLFYYVVLGPFALVLRWRSDPLGIGPRASGGWRPRDEPAGPPLPRARRQA